MLQFELLSHSSSLHPGLLNSPSNSKPTFSTCNGKNDSSHRLNTLGHFLASGQEYNLIFRCLCMLRLGGHREHFYICHKLHSPHLQIVHTHVRHVMLPVGLCWPFSCIASNILLSVELRWCWVLSSGYVSLSTNSVCLCVGCFYLLSVLLCWWGLWVSGESLPARKDHQSWLSRLSTHMEVYTKSLYRDILFFQAIAVVYFSKPLKL